MTAYYQQPVDMWWAESRIKYDNWTGPAATLTPNGFRINPGWAIGNGSTNDVQTLQLSAYFFLDTARMPSGALSYVYGYPWPDDGPKMRMPFQLTMRADETFFMPWLPSPSAAGLWEVETTFKNGNNSGGSNLSAPVTATAGQGSIGTSRLDSEFAPYLNSVNEGLDASQTLNIAVTVRFSYVFQGLIAMAGLNTSSGVPIEISIPPFTVRVRDFVSYE